MGDSKGDAGFAFRLGFRVSGTRCRCSRAGVSLDLPYRRPPAQPL